MKVYFNESVIKAIGEEFDYDWRDMVDEILELRSKTVELEDRLEDAEEKIEDLKNA